MFCPAYTVPAGAAVYPYSSLVAAVATSSGSSRPGVRSAPTGMRSSWLIATSSSYLWPPMPPSAMLPSRGELSRAACTRGAGVSASMRDVWVITRRASGLPRPADRRRRRVACRDGRDRRVEKARQHRGSTVGDGNSLVEMANPLGVVRAPRWGARRGEFMAARSVSPRMRARDRTAADRHPLLSTRRRRVMLAADITHPRLTPLRPCQRGSATPRSRCLTSMP